MPNLFQAIPSVDACLSALGALPGFDVPHALLRGLVREFLEARREAVRAGAVTRSGELALERLLPDLADFARRGARPALRRVLNASGVVIHTNLGRSVLAESARQAVDMAASGYCNLEFDLESGRRGSRSSLASALVSRLTGAGAALAVNNNAAAVLLMLDTFARDGEVVVSRGQLVEVGGSFRIPDVMEHSGARLREVGSTNRTHLRDYEEAVNENTRALMRVHTSNYRIVGFHAEVDQADLAALAKARGLPLLVDLGSGSLVDFTPWGLPGEPTVEEIIRAGADVVTFSGDKVLGGPQAGILAGSAKHIEAMARNPLYRALRCDKLTLAALEATLRLYLEPERAVREIPTLRDMTRGPGELRALARKLAARLRRELRLAGREDLARVSLAAGVSRVGGGSFPERDLPTTLVRVEPLALNPDGLRAGLLRGEPPLVGRVEDGAFLLDARTLRPEDFALAARLVSQALAGAPRLPLLA